MPEKNTVIAISFKCPKYDFKFWHCKTFKRATPQEAYFRSYFDWLFLRMPI